MSSTYHGNASNLPGGTSVTITVPSDGDVANVASVNNPGPFEPIADFVENLYESLVAKHVLDLIDSDTFATTDIYDAYFVPELGLWIAVGNGGTMFTSNTGASGTWSSVVTGVVTDLYSVTSNGTITVVVGASGTIITSTDGATWTPRTSGIGIGNGIAQVAWDPVLGVFMGVCNAGAAGGATVSSDGITWTAVVGITDVPDFDGVASNGNGTFLVIGQIGGGAHNAWTVTASPALAASFTPQLIPGISTNPQYVAYSDRASCFMVVDDGSSPNPLSVTSTDATGTAWNAAQATLATDPSDGYASKLKWNGRAFVLAVNPWAIQWFIPQADVWRSNVPVLMTGSGYSPTCLGVSAGSFHCLYIGRNGTNSKVFSGLAWQYL